MTLTAMLSAQSASTRQRPLHVLMITGAYPTQERPHWGTFIKSQVESLISAGVQVDVVHPKPGPAPIRYVAGSAQVFWRTLTRRYDVVHGHYGLWCLAARMQVTTPAIASWLGPGDMLPVPTGEGGYSRKQALKHGLVIRISRWLSNHVDAVIVKTEEMRQVCPAKNVFVIPNGVDFDLFRPVPRAEARTALTWDPHRIYILFGNDPRRHEKGFPLAQAAIEQLRARGVPAELVIANGLPQTTVVQYINASNALLLSSSHEGSPNLVKETMACNVPIVATDVGDVSQLIGRTQGCYVCRRDPGELAVALESAVRHRGPTTGRADMAHLERSVVAHQVTAVYAQVAAQNAQRAGRPFASSSRS